MRILIVDDHPVMRYGMQQLVQEHWPQAVVGEADCLQQGLTLVRGGDWDLVVLDLSLPDATGMEGLVEFRRTAPSRIPILVWSMHDEATFAQRALELGAAGYLTKGKAASELVTAIERVCKGGRYISTDLAEQLADVLLSKNGVAGLPHETLSPQEYRVFLLIAEGHGASDIADRMHLSVKTVGTYRSRIIEKTGLKGTAEMARYCEHQGLFWVR